MSEVVDPLKFRSFGVKRPTEEKKQKEYSNSPSQSKRSYPINKIGNKDEWGAMIQHQAEMHALQTNLDQIERRKRQEEYRAELKKLSELK